MDRSLNDLSPRFRPLAEALLKAFKDELFDDTIIVIDTLRTPEEQADALARGVSWTQHSKHLTGDAIDVAPMYHGLNKVNWDTTDPIWEKMGEIGEKLGLVWGGRWLKRDMGHFEFKE